MSESLYSNHHLPVSRSPLPPIPQSQQHQQPSHSHTLRPRRSFQRASFSLFSNNSNNNNATKQEDNNKLLRSPLKLAQGKANLVPPIILDDPSNSSGGEGGLVKGSGAVTAGTGGAGRGSKSNASGRGGAMLFPPSPVGDSNPTSATRRTSTTGIKKLASSISVAFSSPASSSSASTSAATTSKSLIGSSKSRPTAQNRDASNSASTSTSSTTTSKPRARGFDLSDWNHDLADIASHPSSSSSSSGPSSSPVRSSTSSTRISLAAPDSNRRRKSDEMEDDDRSYFVGAAVPVRRESTSSHGMRFGGAGGPGSTSHGRSQSLAHAHTLRSSRTLLSSFAFSSPGPSSTSTTSSSIKPSSSNIPTTTTFGSPFSSTSSQHHQHHHHPPCPSSSTNVPPPSKKISLDSLSRIIDEEEEEDEVGSGNDEIDEDLFTGSREREHSKDLNVGQENVFGVPGKKPRSRSLTRTALGGNIGVNPAVVFGASGSGGNPIPPSQSHPGWSGTGFGLDIPSNSNSIGFSSPFRSLRHLNPPPSSSTTTLLTDSIGRRSRAASTSSNLDTLEELGPAKEYFGVKPPISSNLGFGVETGGSGNRRRSSEVSLGGGRLFSNGSVGRVSTRPKIAGAGEVSLVVGRGRGGSLPDFVDFDLDEEEDEDDDERNHLVPFASLKRSTGGGGRGDRRSSKSPQQSSSRRTASLDSLYLTSTSFNSPSSAQQRKRSANGALLAGPNQLSTSHSVSPLVSSTSSSGSGISPPRWSVRGGENSVEDDEDEENLGDDEDMTWEAEDDDQDRSMSVPGLTDGTTSASSSLSTSLSSHAEGDQQHQHQRTETLFKPQNYNDVRPLQAAFISTGLVSKRHSLAGNKPRDSGISMGGLASPFSGSHYSGSKSEGNLDGMDSESSETFKVPNSTTTTATNSIPPQPPILPSLKKLSSVMPDTPVKKAVFALASTSTASSVDSPELAPHSTLPSTSNSKRASRSSFSPLSINIRPGDSLPPTTDHSSVTTVTSIPSSQISRTTMSATTGEMSPTIQVSSRASGGARWRGRPALFRRRSSGQLSSASSSFISDTSVGNYLGVVQAQQRSGSSSGSSGSGSMVLEGEPMTPTRNVGHGWSEATQLIATPCESPLTPATPAFPPHYLLTNLSPPLATPRGRTSFPFSELERRQHLDSSAAPIGRAQNKQRHSGSTLLSLRQQELQQPSWFETNYTLLRALGNGAFSDAFEVFDRQRGAVYAVKRTKHPFSGNKDRLRRLEEVDILRLLTSEADPGPHVISLIDAWEHSGYLYIQTELCPGGNLAVFLEEYGQQHEVLDEARVWKILAELTAGVAHLHDRNVIHLDLKPANVFITGQGHLKLGDFGLATRWPRADALSIVRGAAVPSPGPWDRTSDDVVWRTDGSERRVRAKSNGDIPEDLEREGDREYIAPEILSGRYGKEADVFSLGLIIVETAANVVLPDNGPAWHKLRSNDLSDVDLSRLSGELLQLLPGLIHTSPDLRLTINDVAKHPVVAKLRLMLALNLQSNTEDISPETRLMKGAVVAEDQCFVHELFSSVYRSEESAGGAAMDVDG